MAEVFKTAKLALTTSSSAIYTCPLATTAVIVFAQVANIDGTNSANLTLTWVDSSDSNTETSIASAIPVPAGRAFNPIGGKMILEAGDSIKGLASADGDLAITLGVLEMS